MKKHLAYITLFIIFVLILGSFVFYDRIAGGSADSDDEVSTSVRESTQSAGNTGDTVNLETAETQESTSSEDNQNPPEGDLAGQICYPSEGIPPLTVYIDDVNSDYVLEYDTSLNQSSLELDGVPVGTYVAYAFVKNIESDGGGYTEAVPCGLDVDCEDHTLIEFEIKEGEVTTGVDVCDWYGAVLPDNPEQN